MCLGACTETSSVVYEVTIREEHVVEPLLLPEFGVGVPVWEEVVLVLKGTAARSFGRGSVARSGPLIVVTYSWSGRIVATFALDEVQGVRVISSRKETR